MIKLLLLAVLMLCVLGGGVAAQELSHYYFDDNINDSQNRHNGTYYNGTSSNLNPVLLPGKIGNAINLTGHSVNLDAQYVNLSNPNDLLNMSDNFTIAFWAKMPKTPVSLTEIVSKIGSSNSGWAVRISSDNSTTFVIGQNGIPGLVPLATTIFHHFVVKLNTTGTTSHGSFYIDGVNQTVLTSIAGTRNSTRPLIIGAASLNNNFGYKGLIDDLRIYNYTLSDKDISNIYNDGYGSQLPVANISTTINVSLFDITTNKSIGNFTVNGTVISTGQSQNNSGTNNGTVYFPATRNVTWQLTVWNSSNPKYVVTMVNITPNITRNSENITLYVNVLNTVFFRFFEEDSKLPLNQTNPGVEMLLELRGLNTNYGLNFSTSNGTLVASGVTPANFEAKYSSSSSSLFGTRYYYFTVSASGASMVDLYVINSSLANTVTYTVTDENANHLEGVTIKVLRNYLSSSVSSEYVVVEMAKTNFLGQATHRLKPNGPFYQFILEYQGRTVFTSQATIIFPGLPTADCPSSVCYNFKVDRQSNFLSTAIGIDNLGTSLVYDNVTSSFRLTYSDAFGIVQNITLKVIRRSASSDVTVCNSKSSAATATIVCKINDTTSGTYVATAIFEGSSIQIGTLVKAFGSKVIETFGAYGVFIAVILLLSLVMLGMFNPAVAIMMLILGLLMVSFMGFLEVESGVMVGVGVIGIIAAGIVIITRLRT